MKNSAAIFVIIVVIVIAIGAFFATKSFRPQNTNQPSLPSQVSPPQSQGESVQATLSMQSASSTASKVGSTVRFVAQLDSNAQVAGVQTTIRFDPKVLSIESIEPGTLFAKPEILTNAVDNENGVISYSVGTFSPVVAKGQAFVITAKVLNTQGAIELTFDQAKTKVGLLSATTQRPLTESDIQLIIEN